MIDDNPNDIIHAIEGWFEEAKKGDIEENQQIIGYLASSDWPIQEVIVEFFSKIGAYWCIKPLAEMLESEEESLRSEAILGLMDTGLKNTIDYIIKGLDDEDDEVQEDARISLISVLGYDVSENFDEDDENESGNVRKWWEQNHHLYDSGVCYYFGEPHTLKTWVQELLDGGEGNEAILTRLEFWTGENFGDDPNEQTAKRWSDWWTNNQHRFETGRRYFYGHPVSQK